MDGVYVHDAAALAAVVCPSLFDWEEGKVVVVTDGPARGRTVMDECERRCGRGRRPPREGGASTLGAAPALVHLVAADMCLTC